MRNKRSSRLLACLLSAVLLAGLLSGCGGTGAPASTPAPAATEAPVETQAPDTQSGESGETPEPTPAVYEGDAAIVNLRTEGKVNPLGVDSTAPVFAWQMESDRIGAAQKSYQLTVCKAADETVVWDSGAVETPVSTGITYAGDELEPATAYIWQVTVTDETGAELVSEPACFETSLLSGALDAWDGAQWIGANGLSLDAAGSTVFDITTDIQIPEGSNTASVIFGANDFRLNNALYNIDGLAGENYIRVEIDISGVGSDEGPAIKIYRVGYSQDDKPELPVIVMGMDNMPELNLNELLTEDNKNEVHSYEFEVNTSTLTVYIDGEMVSTGGSGESFSWEQSNTGVVLSAWGSSDAMTFPNLNSIGFAARAGEEAIFTNYQLNNPQYGTGVLFGAEAGATYAIWDGAEGISIDGDTITVGGEEDVLVYADPSFGGKPYLRSVFTLEGEIASARLYAAIQGIGHLYLNGAEVSPEAWFKQGSMEYRDEIGYHVYDVTDMLAEGENAIGAVLAEGWWTGHAASYDETIYNYYADQEALLTRLAVTYADGSEEIFVSSPEGWYYTDEGPLRFASLFEGERYDAGRDAFIEDFSTVDYDDSTWKPAVAVETRAPFAGQQLVVRRDEDVHVIRTLDAIGVSENGEGTDTYIYDLGENVSAVPQITIPAELAKEGETLTIRVAEILYPELEEYGDLAGNLLQENYRAALNTYFYTMKDGEQTFVPDLTFTGYRYLEIAGLDEALPLENVKSLVLSSLDMTAAYESSNPLVNRLFINGQNSAASNFITLPTDCPQRNERMGWMGDANVYTLAGSYNTNTYQFMRQWLNCVRESQGEDGMTALTSPLYPTYDPASGIVPRYGVSFGITWNSVPVFVPYYLYLQYGDDTIIRENLESIFSYMELLASRPLTYRRDGEEIEEPALTAETGFIADHLSFATTDTSMLGNAMYVQALEAVSYMTAAVGDEESAAKYAEMYEAGKAAWNAIFVDAETGKSCSADGTILHTQASYASPLNYGVVSEENLPRFVENFVDTVEHPVLDDGSEATPYTMTTGFNATPNLLNALSKNGRSDVAYRMLEGTEYPSWLYPVTQGATSIWERWNSYTEENGFGGNNSMNSFNHYSLGAVTSWMMDTQLGIKYDPEHPGYSHFILQPVAGGTFTNASGSFESAYGTIRSGWTAEDGVMTSYDAVVPANTTATLYLPFTGELELPAGASLVGETEWNGIPCTEIALLAGTFHFELG